MNTCSPNSDSASRGIAWRLFVTCWIIYCLHFATNIVRELYPAMSLGDHLSFDVSEYTGLHPDIFELKGQGTFINNNPGASIVGAIPYALARPVIDRVTKTVQKRRVAQPPSDDTEYTSPWPMAREFYKKVYDRGLDIKFGLAAGMTQSLAMAPLSALSVVVMFYVLRSVVASVRGAFWLALLYGFATPVFYRTAQLNQNLLVTHCALFAFVLLWRPWDPGNARRRSMYFLAGLIAGWSVVCDYSGVIVVLVLAGYGLLRRNSLSPEEKKPSDAIRFAGGVLLSGCVLMGYQWSCFGNPFYPAQHYMPAAHFTEMGYVGFSWPKLDLLVDTAFSKRFGLFTSAPILLLALWVPGWVKRRSGSFGPAESLCVIVFVLLFFVFCSANQYGRMQFNTGVRHVIPVTPFLFIPTAIVLSRLPIFLAGIGGGLTLLWSWCLSMYRDVELGRGIIESPIHILTSGLKLPWLTTLQRMGLPLATRLPSGITAGIVLLIAGGVIVLLWWPWGPSRPALGSSLEHSRPQRA